MNGIINFYKPKGMTSHGAVNFLRRKLNIKRIGHTGTLDPNVSGVLPLCIGKATRVSEYLLESDKEYIGELTLGIETDSQDSDGIVINSSNKLVTESEIREVFYRYIGEILQTPPMYSAVKVKGKKLYELAREGKTIERKQRKVKIYENDILSIKDNKVLFRVKCSKGTYIRTLCHDIGKDLGTFGYMSYLIRIGTDIFTINNSIGKETIENLSLKDIEKFIYPMDYTLSNFEKIILKDDLFFKVSNGSKVYIDDNLNYSVNEDYRIYCRNEFIGIGNIIESNSCRHLKMKKVLLA